MFYGRLWGITVGGALVAGLILALITWLNRGGDVRGMIWYMLAVDCMMTGYFCIQILPFSTYMSTVPLMLASGCRRKEVILSSQILKFLNFLGILAVTAIFLLLQSRMKGNQVEIHRISGAFHGFFALGFKFLHVQESFGYINQFLNASYEKILHLSINDEKIK